MGNDGGSIPTRRELRKHTPGHIALSPKQPLTTPIVSDSSGILYNKDAILEQLLPKDDDIPTFVRKEKEEVLQGRVKGLRDIVEVKFSMVKEDKEEKKICPITIAIKELKGDTCVECNEAYTTENVISILPTSKEDIARLVARAAKLKEGGLTHSLKKAPGGKKKRKHGAEAESAAPVDGAKEEFGLQNQPRAEENGVIEKTKAQIQENGNGATSAPKVNSSASTPVPSSIKNASAANLTAKVLEEQEERNKRRKLGMNDNLKSLFSNTGYNAQKQKGGDFMTRGFSMNKKS
ncbi:hypothetical protein DID88_004203 [Monilinia fructigena]|uniref:Replication termination factor 2 n=1 Tax=Monilinia fructigena TaxID=38457 RepID=A0A395IS30_9HELO|nr:hypothetical protein DID88_004203 [Monilinia fructigena]